MTAGINEVGTAGVPTLSVISLFTVPTFFQQLFVVPCYRDDLDIKFRRNSVCFARNLSSGNSLNPGQVQFVMHRSHTMPPYIGETQCVCAARNLNYRSPIYIQGRSKPIGFPSLSDPMATPPLIASFTSFRKPFRLGSALTVCRAACPVNDRHPFPVCRRELFHAAGSASSLNLPRLFPVCSGFF